MMKSAGKCGESLLKRRRVGELTSQRCGGQTGEDLRYYAQQTVKQHRSVSSDRSFPSKANQSK